MHEEAFYIGSIAFSESTCLLLFQYLFFLNIKKTFYRMKQYNLKNKFLKETKLLLLLSLQTFKVLDINLVYWDISPLNLINI